jgi:hypothetical protein
MTELCLIAARVTVFLVVGVPSPCDRPPEPDAEPRPDDDVIIAPHVTPEMTAFFRNYPFNN